MNIISFVVAAVMFVGAIALFGYSWDGTEFYPFMFVAGVLLISGSIAIPFHLLKRVDG